MRYMFLVTQTKGGAPPQALIDAMEAARSEAVATGGMIATGGLGPAAQSARATLAGGRLTVTDGPFAEAKELVAGVMELHAAGVERVLEIVSRCGEASRGILESLARDPLVGSLLILHGVHPDNIETRVRRTLETARDLTGIHRRLGDLALPPSAPVSEGELPALVSWAFHLSDEVSQALDDQKNSVNVVSSITAEQIAKSPDGDAAQAVGRVSGVSVQDGKYVFVRGLGDRYTQTSLNGARIIRASPEARARSCATA